MFIITRYIIYAAPAVFITGCILGTIENNNEENVMHSIITVNIPRQLPQLKMKPFLKPALAAIFIDIIFMGPGVMATIKIYERNGSQGNMATPWHLI
jgi:hypothetical protein